MFCFCKIAFGPCIYDWLPITLAYGPSGFSYPGYPHNYFIDCTIYGRETFTVHEHSAVIGGECEPIPNCEPGPTTNDDSTWGMIKGLYR
ncbi:MAG: hypothetical protein KAW17_04435 [Candidatus Eisenbacteria sp.]|nr:hypothetical protein [Candidatus Eisenbacteria bacterium]